MLRLKTKENIQVCKCMKNVFVQCELWCEEILRKVAKPCCTCTKHISSRTFQDLAPCQHHQFESGPSETFAFGKGTLFTECPSKASTSRGESPEKCPVHECSQACKNAKTKSYQIYSLLNQHLPFSESVNIYSQPDLSFKAHDSICQSPDPCDAPDEISLESVFFNKVSSDINTCSSFLSHDKPQLETDEVTDESTDLYYTPPNTVMEPTCEPGKTWQSLKTKLNTKDEPHDSSKPLSTLLSNYLRTSRSSVRVKSGFSSRTPIITTDQMSDWNAMMISSMWNVQAWREWIEECIQSAVSYSFEAHISQVQYEDKWTNLYRKITTEALQWRQYGKFSQQLAKQLMIKYSDKQIVSPTRATLKTDIFRECQLEMLDIINMLYKWTHWLNTVVKETNSIEIRESNIPLYAMRWGHFKKKVEDYLNDWHRYTTHLKNCWEHKYQNVISDSGGVPVWQQSGPVWVVSAYGAVPSGAAAAGVYEGEVTWVARTTHKSNVLPAALHPSKHCCLVYADQTIYRYSKYQVICNAKVTWVAWRAGEVSARAVKVAPGVYVGRVLYRGSHLLGPVHAPTYRCHVVIFGRPFAFNCYELLAHHNSNED